MTLGDRLLKGEVKIAYHGLGFTGLTGAIAYSSKGIYVVGYDPDEERVGKIQRGEFSVPNLEYHVGRDIKSLLGKTLIVTSVRQDVDAPINFVAVPTERNGRPYRKIVEQVCTELKEKEMVVLESTLTPNWIPELSLNHAPFVHAPRRDWFVSPQDTLDKMERIFWASENMREDAESVLSLVSGPLHYTNNPLVPTTVKAAENARLFVEASFHQALSFAYSSLDIVELSKLLATHPRMAERYPSLRIGGYCVPLGAEYLIDGADRPEYLKWIGDLLDMNLNYPAVVAEKLKKYDKVALLGVTYKPDVATDCLSGAETLAEHLKGKLYVHDPYYSADYLSKYGTPIAYPEGLKEMEVIVLLSPHGIYRQTPWDLLEKNIGKLKAVLDIFGLWEKHSERFKSLNITYERFARAFWQDSW